jgi:hypothetical protein
MNSGDAIKHAGGTDQGGASRTARERREDGFTRPLVRASARAGVLGAITNPGGDLCFIHPRYIRSLRKVFGLQQAQYAVALACGCGAE